MSDAMSDVMSDVMKEISATAAARLLQAAPDTTLLLDVREHAELELAHISSATHIPMGEIPARHSELDKSQTIICICHHGGRSAQVAGYLESQGFTKLINLLGGIEAWSTSVDPEIARY
jgi:rhodanese-related sulfurtransferase